MKVVLYQLCFVSMDISLFLPCFRHISSKLTQQARQLFYGPEKRAVFKPFSEILNFWDLPPISVEIANFSLPSLNLLRMNPNPEIDQPSSQHMGHMPLPFYNRLMLVNALRPDNDMMRFVNQPDSSAWRQIQIPGIIPGAMPSPAPHPFGYYLVPIPMMNKYPPY